MLKPVKNFPRYYITPDGEIYSCNGRWDKSIKKMKTYIGPNGYEQIMLCKNKKTYVKCVHRLVAETFIPNPLNKPEVNHINGIRHDNRVQNLEWVTHSENVLHAFRKLKRKKPQGGKGRFGKLHPNIKIVLQIQDGKVIGEFYGTLEANRQTGVHPSNITSCCKGRRESAGGYQWRYKGK